MVKNHMRSLVLSHAKIHFLLLSMRRLLPAFLYYLLKISTLYSHRRMKLSEMIFSLAYCLDQTPHQSTTHNRGHGLSMELFTLCCLYLKDEAIQTGSGSPAALSC